MNPQRCVNVITVALSISWAFREITRVEKMGASSVIAMVGDGERMHKRDQAKARYLQGKGQKKLGQKNDAKKCWRETNIREPQRLDAQDRDVWWVGCNHRPTPACGESRASEESSSSPWSEAMINNSKKKQFINRVGNIDSFQRLSTLSQCNVIAWVVPYDIHSL